MVKKQRGQSISKEYTDRDKYDDIEYMSMACFEELESLFHAFNEHYPGDVDFKCNPDEYYQKLIECKRNCDWLIDNVSFITRL
jgi:hypothetical protein